MNDDEAIEAYNRAGEHAARAAAVSSVGLFTPVRWPDVSLERGNLERLASGVLDARLNLAGEAFGEDLDVEACAERLETAWRTDAMQARFAPEGVFLRVQFTVMVVLAPEPGDDGGEEDSESLTVTAELCLSFSVRHHARPFIDFMGGVIRRESDGASKRIDPFSMPVDPADAIAWELNGP